MKSHTYTIWIVRLTSSGRYGTNKDYSYRTETEANTQADTLRRFYGNDPTRKIEVFPQVHHIDD